MAKVFLTCFPPFKPLSSDELAVELFSSVVVDLQGLQKSLEEKPLSLRWCSEAMSVIKKIHSHFLIYLERSEVPSSWEGVKMLDEYMRATLYLLDLCNLLKSAISNLERYRMMVDLVINRLEDSRFSIKAAKIELEILENEGINKLSEFKKWRDMNFFQEGLSKVKVNSKTGLNVSQVIGNTMSIVSLFVFCLILSPTPIKVDKGFYTGLPDLDSFSDSIQKLVISFDKRFRREQDKGRTVLYENEIVEEASVAFKEEVILAGKASANEGNKIPQCVAMLKKSCVTLKEGLELFEFVINDMFEDVVRGRKKVVEYIHTNNHTA